MKYIVHFDFNYFFVQVEEILDPSLKGKPVAIGSRIGRGIISTSNYVARKHNVRSGMSTAEALKNCPNLCLIKGNHHLYSQFSKKIFTYLKNKFPLLCPLGCDEGFIDLTEELKDLSDIEKWDFLRDLQFEIYNHFQIKLSIGLSYTKFLAKMASDFEKPLGLTLVLKEQDIIDKFYPLSIDNFYGIGKRTFPLLKDRGINTIGDLVKKKDDPEIQSVFGNQLDYYLSCIYGKSSDILDLSDRDQVSVSAMETFDKDTNDYEEICASLSSLASEVSRRLTKNKKFAKTIVLTLRNNEFVTKSQRSSLDVATDDKTVIYEKAVSIFNKFAREGTLFRLVGVGACNLSDTVDGDISNEIQMNLFDQSEKDELDKLENQVKNSLSVNRIVNYFNKKLDDSPLMTVSDLSKKKRKTKTS